MSDDMDLEELKHQTSQGDRIDAASQGNQQAFVEDIVSELEAIEAGDKQKTISLWDGNLAAFVRALEENPDRMEAVGHALQNRLAVDS